MSDCHDSQLAPKNLQSSNLQPVRRTRKPRADRRIEILKTVATLLADPKVDRITTAQIARELSLSEAALYRIFISKADIYLGLLDLMEGSVVEVFDRIAADPALPATNDRVRTMVRALLDFGTANPGFARVFAGQVFLGEDERLMQRLALVFDKFEATFRQRYREGVMAGELPADFNTTAKANLIMSWVIGRWTRYAVTGFKGARPNDVSATAVEALLA